MRGGPPGQAMPILAAAMALILGLCGLAVDVGLLVAVRGDGNVERGVLLSHGVHGRAGRSPLRDRPLADQREPKDH